MAHYDGYPNPSATAGQGIPFVVVIQGDPLDALSTRLVIPLVTLEFAGKVPRTQCPAISVKGQTLHALGLTMRRR